MRDYDFKQIEKDIRLFWEQNNVLAKLREKNNSNKPFYFLDGPPYTSGKVHIGTAWNKSMKDVVVRYQRMKGMAVYDRAGYDMHGLPNENATMKELGLETKEDIEKYGVANFIEACKKRAEENMRLMNEEFKVLGVSLDFENAYQTMSNKWIESVWWLVKKAYDQGRLYEGQRPMAWDPVHETACAKHELQYKLVEDDSIYVKFRRKGTNEYFIIWTTTPWTIPFNLMIMMHPEIDYVKVRVGDEVWILAKELLGDVLEKAGVRGEVISEHKGAEFEGLEYEHFLSDIINYDDLQGPVHTIVLSDEYVTTQAGTGLVHGAPGCGPEDYEVGVRVGLLAFNLLDSKGRYPSNLGPLSGLVARADDDKFIELFEERKAIVAKEKYAHDYPFAERSKAAVVYKTTPQWFFKVDDIKDLMIEENNSVNWNPKAGYNAFNSWLTNLRDNSITKQRYWGTPFPVWKNTQDPDDFIVVGSIKELEELSGEKITDLHKPYIDEIIIRRDDKTYKRLPDIIDVWVDAGVASYAALDYPSREDYFNRFFPADFIIEGNDQVRGWFNLLMVCSILAFRKKPFKNVYMHGMINDSQGRKMSKSLGNYIRPFEVTEKYGVDATRLYFVGGTKAGNDLQFNHDDCRTKHKSLLVYWNIHKYLLDMKRTTNSTGELGELSVEDKYILALYHKTIQQVNNLMAEYQIEKYPQEVEQLLSAISRNYIQYIRESLKDERVAKHKQAVLLEVYLGAIKLLAPICPYITEDIWQSLKNEYGLEEESIHLCELPKANKELIDERLLEEFDYADKIIKSILSARDAVKRGVRWPLKKVTVIADPVSEEIIDIIKQQTNTKQLFFDKQLKVDVTIKPNYSRIASDYPDDKKEIIIYLQQNDVSEEFQNNKQVVVNGKTIDEKYLEITYNPPENHYLVADKNMIVLVDLAEDDNLLQEGYQRELIRRIQELRKQEGFDKQDRIILTLDDDLRRIIGEDTQYVARSVGADEVRFGDPSAEPCFREVKIRDVTVRFGIRSVI